MFFVLLPFFEVLCSIVRLEMGGFSEEIFSGGGSAFVLAVNLLYLVMH